VADQAAPLSESASDPSPRRRVGASATPDADALAALDEATRAIVGLLDVDEVLQLIVDRVRILVGARYAALGIVGPDGRIERFVTTGITPRQRAAIGPVPHGRGLLGLIIREGRTYRVADIAAHPDSSGFPPNHPRMTSFLGVPISARGIPVGNLYLTDKTGAHEFSEADQRLVEMFAIHAGIAIDNARLHERVRELAVVEERERIGRELHDGIIQSLYGVSLSLEDLPDLLDESRERAEDRVDRAIDSIQLAIRELRSFVYGLQPESFDGTDVPAGVVVLAEQFNRNTLVDVEYDVDPDALSGLPADDGIHVLQLVREALSNAARHAKPGRVTITLRRDGAESRLQIADDGVGFDPALASRSGHHGIANMGTRASAVGGRLTIDTAEGGGGTRIILVVPDRSPGRDP
jgi:signal transduction histidine kinase